MEAEVYDGHVHVVMTVEDARTVQNGLWRMPHAPARDMHSAIEAALRDAGREDNTRNEWTAYTDDFLKATL